VFALVWLIVLGNVLAVALACLGSRWLVRIAQVRPTRLVPPLLLLIFLGAFAQRQSVADVFVVALMGALGLVLVRYRWPRAPLLLGVVLGPLVENRFFLSMDAYGSQWLWRPGVIVVLAILAVGLAV
jgi:TctA family transporter